MLIVKNVPNNPYKVKAVPASTPTITIASITDSGTQPVLAETFEYYSKNLKSVNNSIVYANNGFASNIVYSDGTVKSIYYDDYNFVIRVNITASGFVGNKYISYSNNIVSAITYGA